jgi:hypothetical protein
VALKTAMPGVVHKSDVGGVRLGLADAHELAAAYEQISASLGARVLVSAMVPAGVEIAFGLVQDAAFGPFVMVAFGGTWIEYLHDRKLAMAPLTGPGGRAKLISQLRMAKVLQGVRGAAPCDQQALVHVFVQLSPAGSSELGACIAEMDLNPVIVSAHGRHRRGLPDRPGMSGPAGAAAWNMSCISISHRWAHRQHQLESARQAQRHQHRHGRRAAQRPGPGRGRMNAGARHHAAGQWPRLLFRIRSE